MLAELAEERGASGPPGSAPSWLVIHPGGRMQFWDVLDVRGFVQGTLKASRRFYCPEEREELAAEGEAIMWKLARDFDPHRDGYATAGRFSGFAAKYLRLKLEDAYHRLHEEHHLVTQSDGGRAWQYGRAAVSLQALMGDDGEERDELLAGRAEASSPSPTIASLLREQLEERYSIAVQVAGLLGEGVSSERDVAEILGLTMTQVRQAREDLEPVAQRLLTLSER